MNTRILKKIHKRYLADLAVESSQDTGLVSKLSKLELGDSFVIRNSDFPQSFQNDYPESKRYQLSFTVKRVEFDSIPLKDSSWWEIYNDTTYLVFYPGEFSKIRIYMAIDF